MGTFNAGTLSSTPTHLSESVSKLDGQDVYKFTLASSGDINLSLNDLSSGGDADLRLYRDTNNNGVFDSADQQTLTNSSIYGVGREDAINQVASAGTYFAVVNRYESSNSNNLDVVNYQLDLSTTPKQQPSNLLPKEFQVGVLNSGVAYKSFSGNISDSNTADVYDFSVSKTNAPGIHNYTDITLKGLTNDADIRIIRDTNNNGIVDAGEEVLRSNRLGSQNEQTLTVKEGNYLAQVYQYTGSTNYQLDFHTYSDAPR